MHNLKFSEAKEMFYNLLRAMFASGITEEEEAIFSKQLIDYILRHIDDCRKKGLEQEMLPIGYVTLWQGVKHTNRGIFSIRASAGIEPIDNSNIPELMESLKETIYSWGEETFDGIIKLEEDEIIFKYIENGEDMEENIGDEEE